MKFRAYHPRALLALLVGATTSFAATPTLVNGAVSAGGRQAVGLIVVDSAIGGLGGSASMGTFLARHGVVGQLTDVASVGVSASATTVNEGATSQLSALANFTDGTVLPLAAASVAWSVSGGGLASVNAAGLATAAIVYQNTNGIARADYLGQFGTLTLSVLNVNNDDFGTYAGDGIDDAWQVQYFGIGNANAAPTADPDGDGQNNLFEYLAGTDPTSAASTFSLAIARKTISFTPVTSGRTYVVEFATNLTTKNFTPLSGTPVDNAGTRSFTDNNATDAARYYRVKITLP